MWFFFAFFSGLVVAASLMAENTNAGMAVFIADITSMCGFGSDGAAALLSACSFFPLLQPSVCLLLS